MSRTQLPLSVEYILMGLLAGRPMHGYDLYKKTRSLEALRMLWKIKQSHLYALLDRLEMDGMLCSELLPGEARPTRRYQLTEAGCRVLDAWIATPVEHARDIRQDFLARLYFAAQSGPGQAAALIEKQADACRNWQKNLEEQAQNLPPGSSYEKQIVRFRLSQVCSILAWLEDCRKEYAA